MSGIPTNYVNEVYARINAAASGNYPRLARSMHLEGQVRYTLTLKPDGTLVSCRISTSGQTVLDAAAEQAIRAAAPFPGLPDLGGSSYELTGAIGYQLDN
jgi:protein TonB